MGLPTGITFTLAGAPTIVLPLLAADATDEQRAAYDRAAADVPKFGADYDAVLTLRWPTVGDSLRISARVTHFFELEGIDDPSKTELQAYRVARAITFFELLWNGEGKAAKPPQWLTADAPDGPLSSTAILRAYDLAQDYIAAEKKSSDSATGK